MTAKQSPPPLQSRIIKVLDNPNASASELSELIAETELAIVTASETVASERASAADLTSTPSPEAVQAAISRAEAAKIDHDRLSGVMQKLRDRYTDALLTERRERWLSDYKKVEAASNKLLEESIPIDQAYLSAKAKWDDLTRRMAACDLDIRRVNTIAGDLGIRDRLEPFLKPVQPERKWGAPKIANGGLAVELAQSMAPPPPAYDPASDQAVPDYVYDPAHDPTRWWDRRADAEKQNREIGEYYQRIGKQQEDRINAEERERFAALKGSTT